MLRKGRGTDLIDIWIVFTNGMTELVRDSNKGTVNSDILEHNQKNAINLSTIVYKPSPKQKCLGFPSSQLKILGRNACQPPPLWPFQSYTAVNPTSQHSAKPGKDGPHQRSTLEASWLPH